jgi:hypothetical protein
MLNQKDTGKLPTTGRSALCMLIAAPDGAGGYCDVEDGDLPEHFAGRT